MRVEVHLRWLTDLVLGPCQIFVAARILLDFIFGDTVDALGVDRCEFVLVEQQRIKYYSPSLSPLFEEEEKAAVGVIVHLDIVKGESAGNRDFHLADCTSKIGAHVDLGTDDAMQYVHEPGSFFETSLGGFDELIDVALFPAGRDVGVVKEHGAIVLPSECMHE